jgi:hypothetical protein
MLDVATERPQRQMDHFARRKVCGKVLRPRKARWRGMCGTFGARRRSSWMPVLFGE